MGFFGYWMLFLVLRRASSHTQSPDHSPVAQRHPASNCSDYGKRGLLGLWHLQLGSCNYETVQYQHTTRTTVSVTWVCVINTVLNPSHRPLTYLGLKIDLLPFWGLWVSQLSRGHVEVLVTSDRGQLPLQQLLPQLLTRSRCLARYCVLPVQGEG